MTEDPDGRIDATEDATRLLRHLFHAVYWPERPDAEAAVKAATPPGEFLKWLDERMNMLPGHEICEKLDVDVRVWNFVAEGVNCGQGGQVLANVWYAVVLADRPPPQVPLKSMNMVMLLAYDDGTLALTNVFVNRVMIESQDRGFDDALAATIASNNSAALPQQIVRFGLEGLRNESAREAQYTAGPGDTDPYDVFCGLILKFKDQLAPQYRKPVENYLRLFQTIVRPVLPKEALAQLEARKQAAAGKVRGGWDGA
jgi:hypothetical protein